MNSELKKEKRNKSLINHLRSITKPKKVNYDIFDIRVNKNVFDPSYGEGSQIFLNFQNRFVGEKGLDIGTGSGVIALLLSKKMDQVDAVDISTFAVDCAKENIRNNSIMNINVIESDLFENISVNSKYDIITFNPPFLDGVASDAIERTMYDSNYTTLKSFFKKAPNFLLKNGKVFVCFGDVGDSEGLKEIARLNGFLLTMSNTKKIDGLEFYFYEFILK